MRHSVKLIYAFFLFALLGLYSCEYYEDPYYYSYNSWPSSSGGSDKTVEFSGKILSVDSALGIANIEIQMVSDHYFNDTTYSSSNSNGNYSFESMCFDGEKFELFLHDKDTIYRDTSFIIEVANRDFVQAAISSDLFMSKY